ncbi:arsenite efflux transporter metallochaperone ArsD [Geobacter sp. FeAm09]|uniref:arsenite efflux transporter metallochaperone ArsD n=1 Tax=Geobacter sp. FeAm09 TaxID=2597769 RepID=UPI00197ACC89|nr:arsenite efflux transporter metallochaperone ArsD [Geobacter sp. FeAm09]
MKIEIYNPAAYCFTGACGLSVNPELVRIQVALLQIQKQAPGVEVERYGLVNNPQAFAANAAVARLLQDEGAKCLPLMFVDGELVSKGRYPSNEQLQTIIRQGGLDVNLGRRRRTVSC